MEMETEEMSCHKFAKSSTIKCSFGGRIFLSFISMNSEPENYSLDKTAFNKLTFEEAGNHFAYWKNKSYKERLEAACYLINQMFGTTPQTPIDTTVFTKRRHKND